MVRYPLCLLVLILALSPAAALTLPAAADVLDAFPHSLADARGVVVIPAQRDGVLFLKTEDGWGDPVPVMLGGVRRGDEDVVLVIRTRRSLSRITDVDGKVDSEVAAFSGKQFSAASLEGACLVRGIPLPKNPKVVQEMKARLAALSTPPKPEQKSPQTWTTPENREAILGGLVAVATCLAAFRRKKP